MVAYKLFRKLKDGNISSLYINKKEKLPFNEWIMAKEYPTKGYSFRPYWHCVPDKSLVKHLSTKNRIWLKVEIKNYFEYKRPISQGGTWFLAKEIKILRK